MATRSSFEEVVRLYVETSGDRELGVLAAKLSELGKSADASGEQAQQLVAELEKLAATSNNIKSFTTLKSKIAETGSELQKAKERLAGLGAEFDRAEKPTQRLQASLKKAATEVEGLTKQQNRQQVELARTTNALKTAGVDTDKLGTAYQELQDEMGGLAKRADVAARAMDRAGKQSKGAAEGVGSLDKAAKSSSKSLADIATRLTLVSGAAAGAIAGLASLSGAALFTGAIRSAATLEDALSQVRAVSGATAEEMVALKMAAEAGGAATRFSTLEAAQGLGELARATGSATTAIAALPATLHLAQAAGIGVAEAATLMTTTLTQFGLGADQAGRVADVMAKEVNSTTDSMEGLGNALTYAAPLAKQLGLDVEDTAAIIGVLADEGFRGERAGTALRNVFTEMSDPASEFASALRDLGIESTDFATVIEQLAAKGDEGREALLKLDAAARPAITALVDKGGAKLAELEASLRGASGEAERTAQVMGENLSGSAESIRDSFDRTRRSLVEPLLAPLSAELSKLADQLETFAKSPEFQEIKVGLTALFVEGAKAAGKFIEQIDFKALAEDIRLFVGDAEGTIDNLNTKLGSIVDKVEVVGRAFQLIFNAVQATILGLASMVTRVVSLLAEVTDRLTGPARAILEFLGIIDEGEYSLKGFAGGMEAVSDEFAQRFRDNVGEAADAARALADAANDTGEKAGKAFSNVVAASDSVSVASTSLATAADTAKDALEGQAQGAVDAAKATTTAAGKAEAGATRIKKAFADLGIQSQAGLQKAAESARRNFDLIRDAVGKGEASAEDAKRAFLAYAEAARAAVADSDVSARTRVESELAVKAAVLGVTDSLRDMGAAGLDSGAAVAAGAKQAKSSIEGVGSASQTAAGASQRMAGYVDDGGKRMRDASKEGQSYALTLGSVSRKFQEAALAANKYAGSRLFVTQLNAVTAEHRAQAKALQAELAALDSQIGKYDELTGAVEALRLQYGFLGDDALRALAERRKQLTDLQRREQEDLASQRAQMLAQQQDAMREVETATAAAVASPPAQVAAARGTAAYAPAGQPLMTFALLVDGATIPWRTPDDDAREILRAVDRARSVSQFRKR